MGSIQTGQSPTGAVDEIRGELLDRRQRIEALAPGGPSTAQAREILGEIDRAIERLAAGTYGRCEACGDPIEADRLSADPLLRFCLDHLSPAQARDLERDLQLAARVQRGLLPPPQQQVAGWSMAYRYQPLGAVSGDYLDVIGAGQGDGTLTVLLGDIAGKGVAASMLMAHLHAAARALVGLGLPIQQVVAQANRVFCESTLANHYATLVCARLSPDGRVELCNAGHCPPLLVRRGSVESIPATGVPVGLFCSGEFGIREFRLEPAESLVLYTDGVTEARDRHDGEYGTARLVAALAAHRGLAAEPLVEACLADLAAFRAGVRETDDVTLLAIRRT